LGNPPHRYKLVHQSIKDEVSTRQPAKDDIGMGIKEKEHGDMAQHIVCKILLLLERQRQTVSLKEETRSVSIAPI